MTNSLLELFEKSARCSKTLAAACGGKKIHFHFSGAELQDFFAPSLHHLSANGQAPDFHIYCFLNQFDVTRWLEENHLKATPHKTFQENGYRFCSQGNGLFWLDEKAGKAFFVGNDFDAFEPYRSKPFSRLLHWFFEKQGMLWCHGACVGTEAGGALMPGIGGAGKSTAVAAALLGGLDFLGDDYLLIEPEGPAVHSIYSSLMLAEESTRLLNSFSKIRLLQPAFPGNKSKWCHYLYPAFGPQLKSRLLLKAILIPQIVQRQESCILPAGREEAMSALVSSLQNAWLFGGDPAKLLRGFYRLVQKLPVAKLQAGSDLRQVPGLLKDFLKKLP